MSSTDTHTASSVEALGRAVAPGAGNEGGATMERSIEVGSEIRVAFARARQVVYQDPSTVFSDLSVGTERSSRPHVDLSVALGAGASAHQLVEIELGTARTTDDRLELPLQWHAIGRANLFPRFDGRLILTPVRTGTRLQLAGTYTVPLGSVGRFGDGVLGHRLARSSLQTFVEVLGSRLASAVERRLSSSSSLADSDPATVERLDHSEIHIG